MFKTILNIGVRVLLGICGFGFMGGIGVVVGTLVGLSVPTVLVFSLGMGLGGFIVGVCQ